MKPFVAFSLGVVVAAVAVIIMCMTDTLPMECGSCDNGAVVGDPLPPDQGVVITETEFNLLKDRFQNPVTPAVPDPPTPPPPPDPPTPPPTLVPSGQGSWGGRIGKVALQQLINNLDPAERYVELKFGLSDDVVNPKTYLMFLSKGQPTGIGGGKLFITNGGDADSWCPPRCNDN